MTEAWRMEYNRIRLHSSPAPESVCTAFSTQLALTQEAGRVTKAAIIISLIALTNLALGQVVFAAQGGKTLPAIDTFNYAVGTQTFAALYQFSKEPRLVETAKVILDMGSNTIKFHMATDSAYWNAKEEPTIGSLMELARDDAAHRQVLDMPFANYIIWAYPFCNVPFCQPLSDEDKTKEYKEMYEFASYLLKTYTGTFKTFYLGHWEGDWYLHENSDPNAYVPKPKTQGMIDWLNARQKAIDDAKRRTAHHDVQVYNYAEVNLVTNAIEGKRCMTNDVIPKTNVDFVSYSSYDTQDTPEGLKAALDYIESKLPAKPGIAGKRVFIGEYGFPKQTVSPEVQDEKSRQVMRTGLDWGCPFVLYWQMYNNEVDKDGKQCGFWMIDDKNVKQPIYYTHQRFYAWARKYVADFTKREGRAPTFDEYRKAAVKWL